MVNVNLLTTIFLIFYYIRMVKSQGCIKSYTDTYIKGNDLNGVQGQASSCCQLCQSKFGCKAYSWTNYNGGTCWLKNDTQPLTKESGSSTGIMAPSANETYSIMKTYAAPDFFDNFIFETVDYSHGFVEYVDRNVAEMLGLIYIQNDKIYIHVEHNHSLEVNSTKGRPSLFIKSWDQYNSGLSIFDFDHVPTGPGTWPAYWSTGYPWPDYGEIDIYETIDNRVADAITLHTRNNCTMPYNPEYFTGTWAQHENQPATNCSIYQYSGAGCSISAMNGTANEGVNQAGGGVFAMHWEHESFIKIWIFLRPDIPDDIRQNSSNPNPATWGMPTAYFTLGSNCTSDHFMGQRFIVNTDLCGFGAQAVQGGAPACEDLVRYHPELYTDAYWVINSLKIYCKPGEHCGGNQTVTF